MSILKIPIDPIQFDHEFSIELDKVIFLLRFKYNSRADRWTFDVKAEDGTMLAAGVSLVTNLPLLLRFKDVRLPLGDFFLVDKTGANEEPRENSFEDTHELLYKEALSV